MHRGSIALPTNSEGDLQPALPSLIRTHHSYNTEIAHHPLLSVPSDRGSVTPHLSLQGEHLDVSRYLGQTSVNTYTIH